MQCRAAFCSPQICLLSPPPATRWASPATAHSTDRQALAVCPFEHVNSDRCSWLCAIRDEDTAIRGVATRRQRDEAYDVQLVDGRERAPRGVHRKQVVRRVRRRLDAERRSRGVRRDVWWVCKCANYRIWILRRLANARNAEWVSTTYAASDFGGAYSDPTAIEPIGYSNFGCTGPESTLMSCSTNY